MTVRLVKGRTFKEVVFGTADGKSDHGYVVGSTPVNEMLLVNDHPLGDHRAMLVGLKYSHHKRNDAKEYRPADEFVRITMLVAGGPWSQSLWRGKDRVELELAVPGDYVAWTPGVEHSWRAVKQSTMLTLTYRRF